MLSFSFCTPRSTRSPSDHQHPIAMSVKTRRHSSLTRRPHVHPHMVHHASIHPRTAQVPSPPPVAPPTTQTPPRRLSALGGPCVRWDGQSVCCPHGSRRWDSSTCRTPTPNAPEGRSLLTHANESEGRNPAPGRQIDRCRCATPLSLHQSATPPPLAAASSPCTRAVHSCNNKPTPSQGATHVATLALQDRPLQAPARFESACGCFGRLPLLRELRSTHSPSAPPQRTTKRLLARAMYGGLTPLHSCSQHLLLSSSVVCSGTCSQ